MTGKSNSLHNGASVYEVFQKSGLTIDELANKIGTDRAGVYSIFKHKNIKIDVLILLSRVLNHNFLLDLAILVESSESISIENDETANVEEALVTLSVDQLHIVSDEDFSSIVTEFITTPHNQPLFVIAYNSPNADDIIYKLSEKYYGCKGYKMMTNTANLELKPYMVPVFTEQLESLFGKDLDSQIGEVVLAQSHSGKHLIFIYNIPECQLSSDTSDAPYHAIKDDISRTFEPWSDRMHVVCLDSSGNLRQRCMS